MTVYYFYGLVDSVVIKVSSHLLPITFRLWLLIMKVDIVVIFVEKSMSYILGA